MHVPLTFNYAHSADQIATNLFLLASRHRRTAAGRRIDVWSGVEEGEDPVGDQIRPLVDQEVCLGDYPPTSP